MRRIAAALIAGAVTAGGLLSFAAPAAATPRADSVVIVGIPGLRWDDVDAARTPALTALARHGAVAALSVRSAPPVTCPAEGWLTLGAGTYGAVQDPRAAAGCADRTVPPVTQRGEGAALPTFPLLRRLNDSLRFGAEPGLLGAGTRCVSAVGPGAALAGADATGAVTAY
ncbi:MAG: phosphoglyceromutase, partial [Mycobacterium sp.]|nr:phosphoglyceromutase [Mycobacterium sp.]